MRTYARMPISIWHDTYPSDDVRTLVLYVGCGPHSNGIGCYRLPVAYIAADLNWPLERAQAALDAATAKGLASPSQALLHYDEKALYVLWPRAYEASPVESPNGAKALMPFLDSVPKESPLIPLIISMLSPFAAKFPKGYLEGLRSPYLSPCPAEQAASSSCKDSYTLPLPEPDAARTEPVDNLKADNLDFSDPVAAGLVLARLVGMRRLTPEDQNVLAGWCKSYDSETMENVLFPYLERRFRRHVERNGHNLANPLAYFSAGVTAHLAKV